jgi:hypothetical protein
MSWLVLLIVAWGALAFGAIKWAIAINRGCGYSSDRGTR